MTTETPIDELMSLDPLKLTRKDLDAIVDFHRAKRAERAEGGGRRAKKDTGAGAAISGLVAKITGEKPKAPELKRRA